MTKKKTAAKLIPKPQPGRPATFPKGVETTPFPTRISSEALGQLREMAFFRDSPFGLKSNSLGAEAGRVIGEAYKEWKAPKKNKKKAAK